MQVLIQLLGGYRATAFLGLALTVFVVQQTRVVYLRGERDSVMLQLSAAKAAEAAATVRAEQAARKVEREREEAVGHITAAYIRGKTDAESKAASVVAGLRAGNLRLREQWRGCPAPRVSETSGPAGSSDDAAELREEAAGRIVGAGADADVHVRALQDFARLCTSVR